MELLCIVGLGAFVVFSPIFAIVSYFALSSRIGRLREELERESQTVSELEFRLHCVEAAIKAGSAPAELPPTPVAPPAVVAPVPVIAPPPVKLPAPAPIRAAHVEEPPPLPVETPLVPPKPAELPRPPGMEWLGGKAATGELEELLGGSVLNKVGGLLVVVGVALFLSYSIRYHMGPAARVAVAAALSGGLLAGGIALGRRGYRLISPGLIGAGWAGLYCTVYAAGALAPAKVIDNPVVATGALLAVAGAMIAHTLRRDSEAVTGVAYFSAFAALAICPLTPLAVVSLLPLAGSLLVVAFQRDWPRMGLFGCLATWGTLISRGDSGSPLFQTQILFVVFWLLFESFQLLRLRQGPKHEWGFITFAANAIFFLGLSYFKWSHAAPNQMKTFAAGCALLFCASAAMRLLTRPPDPSTAIDKRLAEGSFEAPLAIAATLVALAVFDRPAVWAAAALTVEGEALILAGLRLGIRFPQGLGWGALAVASLRMIDAGGPITIPGGFKVAQALPVALLLASASYLNTAMRVWGWRAAAYCAAAMVALGIGIESPPRLLGVAVAAFAFAQLEFARRRGAEHFRGPAFATGVASLFATLVTSTEWLVKFGSIGQWLPVAAASAIWFAATARFREEQETIRKLMAGAGCVLAMAASWIVLPDAMVAMAWIALAVALAEWPVLEIHSRALAAAAFARLFFANFTNDGETLAISHRVLSVAPAIVAFCHLWRKQERREYLWAAAIAGAVVLRFELGRVFGATGWAALAVLLLRLGQRASIKDLAWQSYGLAGLAFLRSWTSNFFDPAWQAGETARIAAAGGIVAALYAAHAMSPREERRDAGFQARAYHGLLAAVLLFFLLYHEVSGGLLTVAWGLQGALSLAAGFTWRERLLRLPGLAILFVCVAKLFAYDLRNLDTPYRILSFVALGMILLGVSWVYSRFRERIRQLL